MSTKIPFPFPIKPNPFLLGVHPNDAGLAALTFIQCAITFIIIPLLSLHVLGHWVMDVFHLMFAVVAAIAFTRRRAVQAALLGCLMVMVWGPPVLKLLNVTTQFDAITTHESISFAVLCFNFLVTWLVVRYVFGPGQVTGHRVLGAVLVYLNVAVMFSIAYNMLDSASAGAILQASGALLSHDMSARIAELSYFSLTTITTTGYGDLVPVHPIARSLANVESVFGALFPATFVARLVALHLAHSNSKDGNSKDS